MSDGSGSTILDFATVVERDSEGERTPAEQLDNIGEQCLHFSGGSEFDEPLRLRRLKEQQPESYQELASQLQDVVNPWVPTIVRQKFEATRKYISQVVPYGDSQHRHRCIGLLRERCVGYPGKFFLWTDEGTHLHVVHDCPFSNGTCRCRILQGPDFRGQVRRLSRRVRSIQELDSIDWTNVILYFILSKWPCQSQVWINGRLQRQAHNDQVVRWKCMQRERREILAREDAGAGHHGEEEQPGLQDGGESVRAGVSGIGEKRRSASGATGVPKRTKFERISAKVLSLLSDAYCIPAKHIKDIMTLTEDAHFLFDPSNDKYFQSACDMFTMSHNKYTLCDFKNLYSKCTPIFYANDTDPFVYYHTREESFNFVKELLEFQMNNDDESIKMFLCNIRDWFNKFGWNNNIKMNALCIIGPPNSGKNYFFDMIAAIAFNVGHIGRVNNKTNNFALQECYGKRLVVGNEISMEEGAFDDFKKLCEGAAFNIRVKFQGDKIFTKAPVLLISNNRLQITGHVHFEGIRSHTLKWKTCESLKHSVKKPYPLCLFDIYDYYNISIQ